MRMWYNNQTYKCDIIASSAETGYAATKIQDVQLKKTTRTTNVTSVATWDLDAGYGSTLDGDSVAILGHNISTAATAIQFVLSANSDYSGASTSVVLSQTTGMIMKYFDADGKRYARLLVCDSSNSDGYLELGFLYVASYLQIAGGVGIDFPYQPLDSSTGDYSNSGQWFGDEGETLDLYSFNKPYLDNTEKSDYLTMYDEVKLVKPIIMDFNESAHSSISPLYCRFNSPINFNHIPVGVVAGVYNFHWNMNMSLKEMK